MSITWDQARTKVRTDLWRPGVVGVPDDVCDRALHASILELEADRKWLWLENVKTLVPLVVASTRIPLPTDCSTLQSLTYINTSGVMDEWPLERVDLAQVRPDATNSNSSGGPCRYAISNGEIFLDCEAPVGASFELIFTARTNADLDTVVAAVTPNTTLNLEQGAVVANACYYVAEGYLKNDDEARRKRSIYERHLFRLESVEDEARGDTYGGCIQPYDYFEQMAGRL